MIEMPTKNYTIEERFHGDRVWVAVRARGSQWSWLTPDEAAEIGRQWVQQYGAPSAQVQACAS
jgi:hypothetical protein